MFLILGLDGGATKTIAKVLDTDSGETVELVSGPTNYKSVGKDKTKENIIELIKGIVGKIKDKKDSDKIFFKSSCFGFSGCDLDSDIDEYKEIIFTSSIKKFLDPNRTIICNDSKIGLAAGSNNKNRVMLICGTGSNCYGINEEGCEASANGWDYILGDEGSGYSISVKAFRAVMRAFDGRGERTRLTEMILKYLNLNSELELVKWVYGNDITKEEISSLAYIVCKTAEDSDKKSMQILKEEAEEARLSVSTVVSRLKLTHKDFDLVMVGSLFKCEKYFTGVLIGALKRQFKNINIKVLVRNPVKGAIKLAIENLKHSIIICYK